MRYFPMFLDLAGREVLIAGGGEQAAQKLRLLARTEAGIMLMAPELNEELAAAVAAGRVKHLASDFVAGLQPNLVFACTGCVGLDGIIGYEARLGGAVVNVVDRPALCDAITPAIVDRDPLVVAIGTEGTAPVLARQVKSAVEAMLEPRLGRLAAFAATLRPLVGETLAAPLRRRFWAWAFGGAPRRMFREGRETEAERAMAEAAKTGRLPEEGGSLTLIRLPEAPDLLTLRAVQRLQEADLILHDGAPEAVLDLARRDAERGPMDAIRARKAMENGERVIILAAPDTPSAPGWEVL